MRRILRGMLLAVAACMLVLLSGCKMPDLVFNPEELYSLPELPVNYTALNRQIGSILEGGAEYAAPTIGTNIQPVQLVDLNGDGWEEAIAFFRNSADEKPLKIYVFTAEKDDYVQTGLIEASGTAISSIAYEDLNDDGGLELIVGWKATAELQVLEIYDWSRSAAEPLVRTNYVKYVTMDLNQDDKQELVVLRADEEGGSIADCYHWKQDGSFASQVPTRISVTMAELSQQGRVTEGALQEEIPALFVMGVTDMPMAVTDVLTMRNGELTNIAVSQDTGVSKDVVPFCGLYASDINGDGITETPRPVFSEAQGTFCQIIGWYSYDENGEASLALQTCHNVADSWYFQLPESWGDSVRVSRTSALSEALVTFYIRESGEPFLRIGAYTGTNREIKAVRGTQILLSRQPGTLYAAELLERNESWEHGVTADEVRAAFSLIMPEWTTGEN